jgi:uncharacterized protein (DUF885 family)
LAAQPGIDETGVAEDQGMLRWLVVIALTLSLASVAGASDQRSRFRNIWEGEWAWRLAQFPQLATRVGVHLYDHQLSDVSPQAQAERLQYWRRVFDRLQGIDPRKLDASARIDYLIYRAQIESLIANIELGSHEMPLNSDSSFYADLALLPQQHPFRHGNDVRNYIARLRAIPDYFDQHIELMKAGLKNGRTPPRVTLSGREAPIANVAALTDPEQSAYYAPLRQLPVTIAPTLRAELQQQARTAISDAVIPAHRRLLRFMRERYIPGARSELAASRLPQGVAWYRRQIIDYVTEDLAPQQIHRIGLAEVARIRAAKQQIIDELGFDGDFAAFLDFLRKDPQFYARSPDELLAHAAWVAKRADGALPAFFGKLPRLPYGVAAVPAGIAPHYTTGRYLPPADPSAEPGWFWVNTHDLASRPLYALPALTLHEAVPGHHLQHALAVEHGARPAFRRHSYISAYGEGWALYAEELGIEMGIYRTPYERFGQLTYAMWRACRLVVDTGIHAHDWTRQQALDYMLANTALSAHEVTTEVDRYISWPGQALSYMIGKMRIVELRREAEAALGADFDLRAFHDSVLELGSVPLPILAEHVRGWIELQKSRVAEAG